MALISFEFFANWTFPGPNRSSFPVLQRWIGLFEFVVGNLPSQVRQVKCWSWIYGRIHWIWLKIYDLNMAVSENSGLPPQIIHFNRIFMDKPSILGYRTPIFGNTVTPISISKVQISIDVFVIHLSWICVQSVQLFFTFVIMVNPP